MLNKSICFLLIVLILEFCVSEENVKVTLKHGILSGIVQTTILKQQSYNAFQSIPYAEPPVGVLRFLPPKPHGGWEGTYEGHKRKPTCLQFNSRAHINEEFGLSGSEDCLYLSVFTPSLQGSLPVVVFDYSDRFRTSFNGSDHYSPDFFLEEEIIVVMVNHRMDMFGYLTTEDAVIPANAGLKDFILALKWIKQNINQFGGDPNRVTLMGNRGGAALAHILLCSESAKGLFSGVIMQSGTALEATYFPKHAKKKAFQVGEALNVQTEDSNILLEELQKVDPEILFKSQIDVIDNADMIENQMSVFPFSPVVESDSPDAVLTSLPDYNNIVNDVPVIIGFNSREGLEMVSHFIFEPRLVDKAQDFLVHFPIRYGFRFDRNSSAFREAEQEIREFYLKAGYLHYGNILEYSVYVGDLLQNYALDYTVATLPKALSSSLYYYMFDYRGLLNENSNYMARRARKSIKSWGAATLDELCYLHVCIRIKKDYEELLGLISEQADIKILKKMVRLWTNFIKTGNPTPNKEDSILKKLIWDPINKDDKDKQYLHITKSPRMKVNPLGKRSSFWDTFLAKYSAMAVDGLVADREPLHEEL